MRSNQYITWPLCSVSSSNYIKTIIHRNCLFSKKIYKIRFWAGFQIPCSILGDLHYVCCAYWCFVDLLKIQWWTINAFVLFCQQLISSVVNVQMIWKKKSKRTRSASSSEPSRCKNGTIMPSIWYHARQIVITFHESRKKTPDGWNPVLLSPSTTRETTKSLLQNEIQNE